MIKLAYSPIAINDLEQIGDYIFYDLRNPTAARKTITSIQDAIDRLSTNPRIGTLLSVRYENIEEYRYLICGNYLAFYRESEKQVYIDRILYGKRDYLYILFGESEE